MPDPLELAGDLFGQEPSWATPSSWEFTEPTPTLSETELAAALEDDDG